MLCRSAQSSNPTGVLEKPQLFAGLNGIDRITIIKASFIGEEHVFDGGIHKRNDKEIIKTLPKRDQDQVFQNLYDKGYSVPEIAKATNIPAPTLYNRVDAHRGRKDGKLAI